MVNHHHPIGIAIKRYAQMHQCASTACCNDWVRGATVMIDIDACPEQR